MKFSSLKIEIYSIICEFVLKSMTQIQFKCDLKWERKKFTREVFSKMAANISKVFILDKYFKELQKFWETEKKLQGKVRNIKFSTFKWNFNTKFIQNICKNIKSNIKANNFFL